MSHSRRDFLRHSTSALVVAALSNSRAAEPKSAHHDLCFVNAGELARLIRERKVSAREVMQAHLAQISRTNPRVNAIVSKLDDEKCLALADEADRAVASGRMVGMLHGLPIAIKDLEATVGFPNTRGSIILKNDFPKADSLIVARIRAAGALIIGKTNVPEFGLGSHTYNKVFGTTFNPFNLSKSAGGSSGGAAAAVATGMLPLANGSDTGGSLRNPANFNNVVGFRPTVGLVPVTPSAVPYLGLGVKGPIARTVSDAGLLLSAVAGADGSDPASYPSDPSVFRSPFHRSLKGVRVAWSPDLGKLPLDRDVRAVLDSQRKTFEALGCIVEEASPDFSGADEAFLTLRALRMIGTFAPLLATHRADLKPEAIYEAEAGLKLTGVEIAKAMSLQTALMERVRVFQERYEFLICAVNQVAPFDASLDWPREVGGVKLDHYISWMKSAYWVTVAHRPAISVPAGFTADGLPVGIQIVGRHRADFEVLRCAYMFEQATGVGLRRPPIAI